VLPTRTLRHCAEEVTVDLTGIRVLVVDDDADTLELLTVILRSCGATVRAESSARAAVVACDEQSFDVVISDLSMPHADGYSFLRALKMRPGCLRVPTIAVTGFAHHRQRALIEGFDVFLLKPVKPMTLCRCVKQVAA
jgi:CheY-like chemotaxis protein